MESYHPILICLICLRQLCVQRTVTTGRRALMEVFVPQILVSSTSHGKMSSADIHVYSQSLFGGTETLSVLVVDGTYMFIKKTMNFKMF